MAGGEGTRLRPLTSNAPKPMMPIANAPMMEHIVTLLQRHGFDEIVVTVAFMANHIRNYFGDGSELGVRMVYATEETPARHRRLGPQRHGRARRALPRHLRRRAHRHRPRRHRALPRGAGRAGHHRPQPRSRTRSSSASSSPARTAPIERFLEKPTWGQVFSDTINTGIFVLEPEIFDYIAAGRPVDFSGEVFPALLEAEASRSTAPSLEGYWEDVGTLEAYVRAHKDVLDGTGRARRSRASRSATACTWGRGPTSTPTPASRAPPSSATTAASRAAPGWASTPCSAPTCGCGPAPTSQRAVIHDNTYIGEGVRLRGTTVGRACDLRNGVRAEEGVVLGDECFIGEQAVLGAGVKVYPFKTVEARRRHQLVDRVGVTRRPQPVRRAWAWPGWPTSTSPPSWPPGWRWPSPPRSRRTPPSSRPATPAARPACSSGR